MAEIESIFISTMIGMTGVVIGAIISNYVNQKIARDTARKDIIFKKKMVYFENIVECIEKNTKLYKNSIKAAEEKKNVNKIIKIMKKERKKFEINSSPLYLNISPISRMVREFVSIEKKIFFCFEKMKSKKNENMIEILHVNLIDLNKSGTRIIDRLRGYLLSKGF